MLLTTLAADIHLAAQILNVLTFGAGDFYLSSGIRNVGLNNTELRGSGSTQTRLHFSSGGTCQGENDRA